MDEPYQLFPLTSHDRIFVLPDSDPVTTCEQHTKENHVTTCAIHSYSCHTFVSWFSQTVFRIVSLLVSWFFQMVFHMVYLLVYSGKSLRKMDDWGHPQWKPPCWCSVARFSRSTGWCSRAVTVGRNCWHSARNWCIPDRRRMGAPFPMAWWWILENKSQLWLASVYVSLMWIW